MNDFDKEKLKLRNKLLDAPETLTDSELLSILLHPLFPSKPTETTACRLLGSFGNLENVTKGSLEDLMAISGMTFNAAVSLMALNSYYDMRLSQAPDKVKDRLTRNEAIIFIKERLSHCEVETPCMLFLDKDYKKISFMLLESGDEVSSSIDKADCIKKAVTTNAKYVVLAHNHPLDNANPSDADIRTTRNLAFLLANYGIILLDHIIVSPHDYCSLYETGYIDKLIDDDALNIDVSALHSAVSYWNNDTNE